MLNWLVDNPTVTYALVAFALLLVAVAWRTRRWKYAGFAGIPLVLIGLFWLLGTYYPSDERVIQTNIESMAAAVKARDIDGVMKYVASDFRFQSSDRNAFRQHAQQAMTARNVEEVLVWDFESEGLSRERRSAKMKFSAKAKGNWGSDAYYAVVSEFVLEPDGEWRMRGFTIFNPLDKKQPIQVPGF